MGSAESLEQYALLSRADQGRLAVSELSGRQHLLFISERSRLPVVLPITELKRLTSPLPPS